MKRSTAQKLMLEHLNDYRKRLAKDSDAWLHSYRYRTEEKCPLCDATATNCGKCLTWPGGKTCIFFMIRVNRSKTVRAKLRWIDKLEAELDQWAAEI